MAHWTLRGGDTLQTPQCKTCTKSYIVQGVFNTSVAKGNKMLSLDEIRKHLQYMVLSRVAHETGVDRGTLIRIKDGIASRPSHATVKALSDFLQGLRDDQ